ncbi:hypothetical protein [Sinomicrobium weinanense]|uniref:Uncharacterized protein n=1 Tax=Sinomicrobium weinanense TaxID=2842200 RepID=A0A926JU25_9FLAO|nr:hypothetical protein [Sinomicrobium weinanense]MBC9797533.1 hypothetical protein [Sinomicrobium weinanense]MBU3122392.1 hypothetical protein [Sinomicrobium weinanense]
MENPFKKIIQDEELPESIRGKVMDDIALIKLSLDVADLVAVKYPLTVNELLNIKNKRTKK